MMLELRGICAGYAGADEAVLTDIDLRVARGELVGVSAPSGWGKSTLLKVAALLHAPTRGSVLVDGATVRGVGYAVPQRVRRQVGLVLQSPRAATNPRFTLREVIAEPLSFADGRRRPEPAAYAEQVGALAQRVHLSEDLLDRHPFQVSDGQLQRAALARALSLGPGLLVCDEPTAMLDAPTTAVVMAVLREHADAGGAVLLASHDRVLLDAAADRVLEPSGTRLLAPVPVGG